jgi:predicted  nucleic acid-binding Zn-ribbon protein
MCAVRQAAVRRKVQDLQERVVGLRAEAAVLREQIEAIDAEVDDLRVRAAVSETPLAVKEHAEAARHAQLAHRALRGHMEQIGKLEAERDRLLSEVAAEAKG